LIRVKSQEDSLDFELKVTLREDRECQKSLKKASLVSVFIFQEVEIDLTVIEEGAKDIVEFICSEHEFWMKHLFVILIAFEYAENFL
jgi:hypothetical protein